ncbi:MAG: DNA-binding transcriptional regulator GbsR (MarR family) [Planctomycetota bacterium]|jgi:DNA-binding transcriptional regulator GbsR (MarR family)
MQSTDDVRQAFLDLWSSLATFWGIPPNTARVYAWLLASAEPVDAETLSSELEMSRGAISMATRDLKDWGLVLLVKPSGSRRTLFRPETDPDKVVRNIVATRKRREWDPLLENMREWIPELKRDRSADAKAFRERLETMEAVISMADDMAEVFLKGGLVQKLGLKVLSSQTAKRKRKRKDPK